MVITTVYKPEIMACSSCEKHVFVYGSEPKRISAFLRRNPLISAFQQMHGLRDNSQRMVFLMRVIKLPVSRYNLLVYVFFKFLIDHDAVKLINFPPEI
jgi:hypothetical protein